MPSEPRQSRPPSLLPEGCPATTSLTGRTEAVQCGAAAADGLSESTRSAETFSAWLAMDVVKRGGSRVPTEPRTDRAARLLAGFVAEWGDRIIRFAWVYTGDAGLAQDVSQETFLRLYQTLVRDPAAHIRPGWLFAVARHVAIDALRRRRRRQRSELALLAAPDDTTDPTERLSVRHVVDSLPDADRQCLHLFYFAGWTIEEIAHEVGLSPGAIKTRLHRARRRFAQAWGEPIDE